MLLNLLFLNGEWVDQEDQVINFQDRAFHYGDGVFETLKTISKLVLLNIKGGLDS